MAFPFDTLNADVMALAGERVTYTPRTGQAYDIADAVFDAAYTLTLVDPESGAPVTSTGPALGVRRAAMQADPVQSDKVTVTASGARFLVRDTHPDGHGWILLRLNKTA